MVVPAATTLPPIFVLPTSLSCPFGRSRVCRWRTSSRCLFHALVPVLVLFALALVLLFLLL